MNDFDSKTDAEHLQAAREAEERALAMTPEEREARMTDGATAEEVMIFGHMATDEDKALLERLRQGRYTARVNQGSAAEV